MIDNYVVGKEKRLYAISLVFSILIWLLIIVGVGAGISGVATAASATKNLGLMDQNYEIPDTETSEFDFTGEEDYDETAYDDTEYAATEDYETEYDESTIADTLEQDLAAYENMDFSTPKPSMGEFGVTAIVFVVYILLIIFVILFGHIIAVGHLMGNGVRVTEKQFPELWAAYVRAAKELDVKKLPAFYLVESGGMLNAFATRLFTRNYVALYADLAELLYEGEETPVSFVIAHELIHVKRNHMIKGLITLPAAMIPFLRQGWKRACEYTCDAGAAMLEPKGSVKGLCLLAAGKKLSSRMSVEAYLESFNAEKSVWKRFAELFASHPHLPKRIKAIREKN